MTEELNDQWRRLYAAGKVRWVTGMVGCIGDDHFVCIAEDDYPSFLWLETGESLVLAYDDRFDADELAPAWGYASNGGCLLAMAREATGDATMTHSLVPGVLMDGVDVWCIIVPGVKGMPAQASTEAGALLAAIEVA